MRLVTRNPLSANPCTSNARRFGVWLRADGVNTGVKGNQQNEEAGTIFDWTGQGFVETSEMACEGRQKAAGVFFSAALLRGLWLLLGFGLNIWCGRGSFFCFLVFKR